MPRSVFTPSFSRPRFSILPTTPTAEMTRSTVMRLRLAAFLDGRGDAVALLVELGHFRVGQDLDALLLEALARERLDFVIFDRKNLRQHLNHSHFGTERAVERGELDADGARADHQQRFRHTVRRHRLEIGPHQFLVGLEARQHARARAGGDDDVLGLILPCAERALRRLALRRLHRDLAGRIDRRLAPDDRHLVLLHQEADAVIEPL